MSQIFLCHITGVGKCLAISHTLIVSLKLQWLLALVLGLLLNVYEEIHTRLYHKLVSLIFDNCISMTF